ncbi:MAG: hypothetical protein DMD97_14270 [Candidatus Rokuibacteriota bacterium]|nr:MAG: hypothetical protein DMD97_14270 [Candidatus Rokubacteria bacterium]
MPPRIRLFFSALSVMLFFIAAVPLYSELSRRSDIWWTPHAMIAPFAESKDRVEIYARGKPLAALLQAGQLRLAEDGGWTVVAPSDIGLRFNNWDRVRAERLPLLLVSAAGCGVTAFMFLLIVTGRLAYRGERKRGAAS